MGHDDSRSSDQLMLSQNTHESLFPDKGGKENSLAAPRGDAQRTAVQRKLAGPFINEDNSNNTDTGFKESGGSQKLQVKFKSYSEALQNRASSDKLIYVAYIDFGALTLALNFYTTSLVKHGIDNFLFLSSNYTSQPHFPLATRKNAK